MLSHWDVVKEKDDVNSFGLPDYHKPIFLSRPNEDGGSGVGLYISKEFNFRLSGELAYNSNESQILFVDIKKRNHQKLIGATYKPPKTDIDNFLGCFQFVLDKLDKSTRPCYLAGDFNIDLLKCSKHTATNSFFDTMLLYSLVPTIIKPSRITADSATLINNIYINNLDIAENIIPGILYTDISDHLPVFIIQYSTNKITRKKHYKWEYSLVNEDHFDVKFQWLIGNQSTIVEIPMNNAIFSLVR